MRTQFTTTVDGRRIVQVIFELDELADALKWGRQLADRKISYRMDYKLTTPNDVEK